MATSLIRIFSDLHFGDRASSLPRLAALTPLFDGASQIVLNGDTIDTRPSRDPATTTALVSETHQFFRSLAIPVVTLTGNHDPDLSAQHAHEIAGRQVFVAHGDILFDDIVPWGRDAGELRLRFAAELAALPAGTRGLLSGRFGALRRATAVIPQRHQSERHRLKYLVGFLGDTIWPPTRILRVLRAWHATPALADALVRDHGLPARVFVMGHTHRAGATRTRSGLIILNTGSFCPPGATAVVDVRPGSVTLRRVNRQGPQFRLGPTMAEFALAGP